MLYYLRTNGKVKSLKYNDFAFVRGVEKKEVICAEFAQAAQIMHKS